MRRRRLIAAGVAMALGVLPAVPAGAWRTPFESGGWAVGPWGRVVVPGMVVGPQPPLVRWIHPPGMPLSYADPASGATYCFSRPTGFYYVCGYAGPAVMYGDAWSERTAPWAVPPGENLPAASAVLLFRLPDAAQASVDGEPVELSGGLGVAAVRPGSHTIVVRVTGREDRHAVTVVSRAILTVTASGIATTNP